MTRSVLTLLESKPDGGAGQPVVIGFHDYGANEVEGLRLAQSLHPDHHAFAPRGLRYCSPRYHQDPGGYNAFLWYVERAGTADPASFGDALSQVEAVLLDIVERRFKDAVDRPALALAGQGQGGGLSLVLGAIWPELVRSISAVDAVFPDVPGWDIPVGDMTGVSVALFSSNTEPDAERQAETEATLRKAGATVVRKPLTESPAAAPR